MYQMKTHIVVCGLAIIAWLTQSCSPQSKVSRLKIDNGLFITAQSKNRVPAVYFIENRRGDQVGACTATAVSHNTLVYAAHCSEDVPAKNGLVRQSICIGPNRANPDSTARGKCAERVFIHPSYQVRVDQDPVDFGVDFAVALFADNTFENYFAVQQEAPTRGTDVIMVGFSTENGGGREQGSKRWGYNDVDGIDRQGAIVSVSRGSAQRVGVSPGDSGGPLFSDCKVVGVASREGGPSNMYALHTNLTAKRNVVWMETLQREEGAYFCGLPGVDNSRCLSSQLGGWDLTITDKRQQQEFPCAPSSEGSSGLDGLFVSIEETGAGGLTPVRVATKNEPGLSVKVCEGSEACSGGQPLRIEGARNETAFFEPQGFRLIDSMKLRVELYSASGQLLKHQVVAVRKK